MLYIIIKKMQSNKTLFICLIIGAVLVTALTCSIPLYTSGASTKVLRESLEQIRSDTDTYPGEVTIEYPVQFDTSEGNPMDKVNEIEAKEVTPLKQQLGLPIATEKTTIKTADADLYRLIKPDDKENYDKVSDEIWAIKDMEEHISIVEGRMFQQEITDDCLEIILSRGAYSKSSMTLGEEIALVQHGDWYGRGEMPKKYIKVKLVGIYEMDDPSNDFWRLSKIDYAKGIMAPYNALVEQLFVEHPEWMAKVYWQIGFDYKQMEISQVRAISSRIDKMGIRLFNRLISSKVIAKFSSTLKSYEIKEKQLIFTIWILISPIMLMLVLYICMISQLIVMNDQNEIAGLKSRGASKWDILKIYLWEIFIISSISFIVGPLLSLLICKLIGSCSGFLEFVGRKALPIKVSVEIYAYALMAQIIFFMTMIIPVLIYSKVNIVEHKQKSKKKKNLWQRTWIDIISLVICAYWYYSYMRNEQMIVTENIDPLLYLVATLFIIGLSLLFIRVYPWCIKLIYTLGKNKWAPTLYATLNHMSRIKGGEQFIMLFMIMAIAIGILNANEARTINTNRENSINARNGAEVVVIPSWKDRNAFFSNKSVTGEELGVVRVDYWEGGNDYEYEKLDEVQEVTKVVTKEADRTMVGSVIIPSTSTIMGVEPTSFGKVVWSDREILPVSINEYLNILAKKNNAMFVSSKIKEYGTVEVGDTIRVSLKNSKGISLGEVKGVICGFIDYWPSLTNKVYKPGHKNEDPYQDNMMIICNLNYLQNSLGTLPYNIWLKKASGVTDQVLLDVIKEQEISYKEIHFTRSQIIEKRTDAFNMGINGMLTLGFIIIMLITLIGFIIYWMISIKGRALQFGILRAMGLKQKQMVIMLALEQLFISGIAVTVGILIGGLTSDLFIPLLYKAVSDVTQGYPFKTFYLRIDYYRIYIFIVIVLMSGLGIVIRGMKKMKLSQIIKLGEE